MKHTVRRMTKDERGITGLETAIILIAFVVVATIFAFVVLTTGVFSAERGKETVYAGLEKARGTMEVRGGVVVTATGTTLAVDDIQFAVATTAGGEAIPLEARILSVADAIDAMLSPRSYKSSYSIDRVRRELIEYSGRQFDPRVVAAAVQWLDGESERFERMGDMARDRPPENA